MARRAHAPLGVCYERYALGAGGACRARRQLKASGQSLGRRKPLGVVGPFVKWATFCLWTCVAAFHGVDVSGACKSEAAP